MEAKRLVKAVIAHRKSEEYSSLLQHPTSLKPLITPSPLKRFRYTRHRRNSKSVLIMEYYIGIWITILQIVIHILDGNNAAATSLWDIDYSLSFASHNGQRPWFLRFVDMIGLLHLVGGFQQIDLKTKFFLMTSIANHNIIRNNRFKVKSYTYVVQIVTLPSPLFFPH